jgi:cyclase
MSAPEPSLHAAPAQAPSAPVRTPRLDQLAPGVFAYLQVGGWGYSNAGLIAGDGAALLVDTLYDTALTEQMLRTLRSALGPSLSIDSVVNTHANGDHCWGNRALPDARVIASRATADEMRDLSPRLMSTLVKASRLVGRGGGAAALPLRLLGALGVKRARSLLEAAPFVEQAFGSFDFGAVKLRLPDQTFEGALSLEVGGTRVELLEVGPAHTRGDTLVVVPGARVAYTGDILFIGSHPIVWEGPIENWIRACDRLLALEVDVIVPGHGPVTNKAGVRATRDYWQSVLETARRGSEAGAGAEEIARELAAQHDWAECERVVVNVDTALRQLRGDTSHRDPLSMLAAMARFARQRG